MSQPTDLDVITIGRCCVDLYADQVGSRLEDARSFSKYIGGCPTNIASGAARLGLKSALISRVGDEHFGRFVRETLDREGVDTSHLKTDPQRLTALAILGIEDRDTFPLLFVRTDCADAALEEADIDEAFIASAKAVVVTGTHFSKPHLAAASRKAMRIAKQAGRKVILDIDYRPSLWGLLGMGAGQNRFVQNDAITAHLQSILPDCDVVVGTDEEVHIAGGTTDTLAALRAIRAVSKALIVLKQGPKGCVMFPGAIPNSLDEGISSEGFPVEVFNVLGAGDGFMAGFLRGYLRDLPLEECCRIANACGALAVSRHGCAPSYPTWEELQVFLERGVVNPRVREDEWMEHVHWASTRRYVWKDICALAIDHRVQLEQIADEAGAPHSRIPDFKKLALEVTKETPAGSLSKGMLLDGRYGEAALFEASRAQLWVGRPVELPGSKPLAFEVGHSLGVALHEWPDDHVVKCLVFYNPEDPQPLRDQQIASLQRLAASARGTRHELLLEVIIGAGAAENSMARALEQLYAAGLKPDWWKLPDQTEAGWAAIAAVIAANDPYCRGVLLLGLDAGLDEMTLSLQRAARQPICKGFAVGRTIFGDAARDWFAGRIDDAEAKARMAARYRQLIDIWQSSRQSSLAA
ncbi:5-dehydro-2-deoxygluconokinase [Telmatospirillum sp. J64-1]|uniref:bifunctional 5-dehydro-2-deoxygluconokinase/5-dehydro-2- deoxyphosphogluconate aldolase n=1 Tax=Telmatospirillum sp. J64-1 TaxID=2502183 RepID=UPI00115C7994|nr:5-dehydro-2-deoxygluconokinase [Telmatospirillum sp. J64-1]